MWHFLSHHKPKKHIISQNGKYDFVFMRARKIYDCIRKVVVGGGDVIPKLTQSMKENKNTKKNVQEKWEKWVANLFFYACTTK